MTTQQLRCAVTALVFTGGMGAVASVSAQSWEPSPLPEKGGMITLVGCYQRGGPHNMPVLTNPTTGAVNSVTEETCSAPYTEQAIELKDTHDRHLGRELLGRWIEVSGRLEKLEGHYDLDKHKHAGPSRDVRELHVRSFKVVPVAAPRAAEAVTPPPAIEFAPIAPQAPAPIESQPVATTGEVTTELPHTASSLPLIELLALVSLSVGLGLHLFNRRRVGTSMN